MDLQPSSWKLFCKMCEEKKEVFSMSFCLNWSLLTESFSMLTKSHLKEMPSLIASNLILFLFEKKEKVIRCRFKLFVKLYFRVGKIKR